MELFGPAWMTKNERRIAKAVAYVNGTDDVSELVRIYKQAPLRPVRDAALDRMAVLMKDMDETDLCTLYEETDGRVGEIVLRNLKTSGSLRRIFESPGCRPSDRRRIIRMADDREFLLDIIRNGKYGCASEAMACIDDRAVIMEYACGSADGNIAKTAMARLDSIGDLDTVIESRKGSDEDLLKHAYRCRDRLMCSSYGSEHLGYASCRTGKIIVYHEEEMYGEYVPSAHFSGDEDYPVSHPPHGHWTVRLEYPIATVVHTDEIKCRRVLVCPDCFAVFDGKRCPLCDSKLNPVSVPFV